MILIEVGYFFRSCRLPLLHQGSYTTIYQIENFGNPQIADFSEGGSRRSSSKNNLFITGVGATANFQRKQYLTTFEHVKS